MAPAFSSEAVKGIPVTRNMRWAGTLSQLGTRRRSISQLPCGVCSGLRAEEEQEFALSLSAGWAAVLLWKIQIGQQGPREAEGEEEEEENKKWEWGRQSRALKLQIKIAL